MKKYWIAAAFCVVFISVGIWGCQKKDPAPEAETSEENTAGKTGETMVSASEESFAKANLNAPLRIANETDEALLPVSISKNYRLKTDGAETMAPSLALFDDGTFGFTYDFLSSYHVSGTYELADDRLTAVTHDGLNQYVFKAEENQFTFIQSESSDIALTDKNMGVPIIDGSVFVLMDESGESVSSMTAVVKEIEENSLLVSSVSDDYPGDYYVLFNDIDISLIKAEDRIIITWNGIILESYPAQIHADAIEPAYPK